MVLIVVDQITCLDSSQVWKPWRPFKWKTQSQDVPNIKPIQLNYIIRRYERGQIISPNTRGMMNKTKQTISSNFCVDILSDSLVGRAPRPSFDLFLSFDPLSASQLQALARRE